MRICVCCQQHKQQSSDFKVKSYAQVFKRSIEEPADFWAEQAEQLVWEKKWTKVLDNSNPPFTKWYVFYLSPLICELISIELKN